ncbi:hypothetical protein BOX15_Mlig028680g2 [Macrostomum lignano]|uniref:Ionotropic glutamate receptor C-terminal domain-containing protein n=1 Tax=Macrostomum lignano TaxID=282301 RepID=A0A267FK62_9PLAT|nr:hypothetical protein BOX15_Mlig028680g2 [Macrostomum lignano]
MSLVNIYLHLTLLLLSLLQLVVMTTCAVNISQPLVEPAVPAGQRSLLDDLTRLVADGGSIRVDPAGRRLLEADPDSLQRAVANQRLAVTSATPAVLKLMAGLAAAVSQPMATLDACLVWRRTESASVTAGVNRDGLYFLTLFHSSVWSMLLLCLLLTISILTILEAVHPIGMRSPRARRLSRGGGDKPIGAFHALAFSTAALLMVGYPRTPKSTAGRVLGVFWWLFAFSIAVAYLSATVLVFLTTQSEPVQSSAGLVDVLSSNQSAGRTVLCAAGEPLCSDWARPEQLALANFTEVPSDSAGLEQLLQQQSSAEQPLLLLTHQFACANLMAVDTNQSYSVGILAKSVAWVGLAGPLDLVRQADAKIVEVLAAGRIAELGRQHGLAGVEIYNEVDATGRGLVGEWLSELRLGLPYRIGSFYGPLILLLVGFGLTLCTTISEFCYYRFFFEPEEEDAEEALAKKESDVSVDATMDTYL